MRRPKGILAAALAAAACAASVAGCAPPPGNDPWGAPAGGGVTVTIVTGTDSSISAGDEPVSAADTGMYRELTDWWNQHEALVTGITMRLEVIDGGSATVDHSEMLGAAQAGDGRYDIYNLDGQWVPEFAAAGYIRLLDGHLDTSGFLRQPLASGRDTAGRLYAAPFTTDVGLLYYRTDLVPRARSLGTFGAVMQAASKASAKDPEITQGYAGQFAEYEGLTVNLLEIIRGYEKDAIGPDGTIRDPAAVAVGLQQLVDQVGQGGQIPGSELSATEAQSFTAFATGKAVFMRNWPIYYNRIATSALPGSSQVARHFDVAPLPFPSVLGGQDLAISTASPHPAEALQVIRFLTSAQAERCLFAVGGFPATRQDAYAEGGALPTGYQAPGYQAVTGPPLCGTQPGQQLNIGQTILDGINKAIPRPVTPYYTEFSTLLQDQVWPLLRDASRGTAFDMHSAVAALAADLQVAASGHAPASLGNLGASFLGGTRIKSSGSACRAETGLIGI
jgi:multiple sugar transport system substrate-binding protein